MFAKILIANRGEIACRVIRTAHLMGIATVAVYSDADVNAPHVAMAGEAVRIGPAPAAKSYLDIDAILGACHATGADAVHPGYGFLSENARFAEALAGEGIAFIGPPVRAIEAMGDKIASKRIALAAGVATVPGTEDAVGSAEEAVREARRIGFPVMLKATAGGGGKGMRIAGDERALCEGFAGASSEARSAFGDDRMFIEKFIESPRHIEIQVLADRHGAIVHLGERECSIQRRNQKVIEEAPSRFVDDAMRAAMGAAAVSLAGAVGYESAGTVEFIVAPDGAFYFLEMNTRLQVEHAVTELVYGLDLVETMIRIAAGEKLAIDQTNVVPRGWAIEARVYAEDPARNFLPSTGRLVRCRPPQASTAGGLTLRNDTGIEEGSEISVHYDPMIAKLVTHGPTREAASRHMLDALDRFTLDGVETNLAFLSALIGHPRWDAGDISTGLIGEQFPDGFLPPTPGDGERRVTAAIAAAVDDVLGSRSGRPPSDRTVVIGDWQTPVEVVQSDGAIAVSLGEDRMNVETGWRPGELLFEGRVDGESVAAQLRIIPGGVRVARRGTSADVLVLSPREAALRALMPVKAPSDLSRFLICPMPGTLVSLAVEAGQAVKPGEVLCVVEAMKMENVLRAERDATVATIRARPGDSLAVDAIIMEFG